MKRYQWLSEDSLHSLCAIEPVTIAAFVFGLAM